MKSNCSSSKLNIMPNKLLRSEVNGSTVYKKTMTVNTEKYKKDLMNQFWKESLVVW